MGGPATGNRLTSIEPPAFWQGSGRSIRASISAVREPQGEAVALGDGGTVYLAGEGGAKYSAGTFARLSCKGIQ